MEGCAWEKLRAAADRFGRSDLWMYAASGTYYLFFSLGPLAVVILALLPWLGISQEELTQTLLHFAPGPFREMMGSLAADIYTGSPVALLAGLAVELWSAGKFFGLLMRCVSRIYDGEEHGGFLRRRLMGSVYTAAVIALTLGNLALLLGGERWLVSAGYVSRDAGLWSIALRCRGLVFFLAVTGLNALLFRTVPRRELTFKGQLPGAAFAAASWLAFSRVYSWAVDRFRFFSIYGGLAIVILSLFWIYCSLYLLFLGAWLNALRAAPAAGSSPASQ